MQRLQPTSGRKQGGQGTPAMQQQRTLRQIRSTSAGRRLKAADREDGQTGSAGPGPGSREERGVDQGGAGDQDMQQGGVPGQTGGSRGAGTRSISPGSGSSGAGGGQRSSKGQTPDAGEDWAAAWQ
jgi:hypothetical protein